MRNLRPTLQEIEAALLPTLAKAWKVNLTGMTPADGLNTLSAAMLDPKRAEAMWDSLDDAARGALQMLIGSGGKMSAAKFGRLFGEIRQMGAAQIERENPLAKPASKAEALYYRGLISTAFELVETGPQVVVYVPTDLSAALPLKKTSYPDLQSKPDPAALAADAAAGSALHDDPMIEPQAEVRGAQTADTAIVDDLTTLLAYLQLTGPLLDSGRLAAEDHDYLIHYLLKPEEDRLYFTFALGVSADLIDIQGGRAFPKKAEVRRWLSDTRAGQVKALAEAWRKSTFYRELWQVEGLHPEPGGELDEYNAAVARGAVLDLMTELVPKSEWWSVEQFIDAVRESEPDFQRPGGDYDSWYIRDDDGEFLMGYENWNAIEGALLEYLLLGPLFWLGLADRADDAVRFNAYGRAFLGAAPWPTPPDPEDKIQLKEDGTLLIPRKISRVDRYQAARFSSWVSAGDPYVYRINGSGIQRAAEQGINSGHIASFLSRALGDLPLPKPVALLLDNWKSGAVAAVTLERLLVLRTTAPDTLDRLLDTPAIRRYLGARLGPMAVIVRADQAAALRAALAEAGITAEVLE
jgi:hypothetical protein